MERDLMTAKQGERIDKELHQDSVKSIIPHQRLSEFRKLVDDLSGKVENLLFVIWIQDQRHDYWMKFIREVRTALEILMEEIKEDERLFHGYGVSGSLRGESEDDLPALMG